MKIRLTTPKKGHEKMVDTETRILNSYKLNGDLIVPLFCDKLNITGIVLKKAEALLIKERIEVFFLNS